ncbi:AMP-binding protein [Candidatus Binatia bacterium]|nr:AMP-binding protein [Candidatus Binatia bacterium]
MTTPHRRWPLVPPPEELQRRYLESGQWLDTTLGAFVDERLQATSALDLRIWSRTRPWRGTIGDVRAMAYRVAGGLRTAGIGPGDVVAFQLPNWIEAAATFYGASLLGAVLVPVVHFYGAKEVRYILAHTGARALITAASFRQSDYLAALATFRGDLPQLEIVVVVGDDARATEAGLPFAKLLDAQPIEAPLRVDPREPAVIGFTSGTTSDPKGVIHSHHTIVAETRQLADMQSDRVLPLLVGAPVGHAIGMLSGLLVPLCQEKAIHLLDLWDPPLILDAMLEADLTCGSGATYFLTSLLDAPGFTREHLKRMTRIGLGGAPVPAAISDRADALGISIVRSYGSTEHPSSTGAKHEEPAVKRKYTDGHALWGVELKLVDEDGNPVAAGHPGEILTRGPDRFVGYTDPALSAAALDADGWYATGDIGVLDADGYLTITDRKKDIIIRGGENVSAAEVEEILMRMPGVTEVAVVAAPDARFGEHACAVLRMQPGHALPDLDAVRAHFAAAGLAKQKWPEEICGVDDFPRTPSGKIKKFVLRAQLRERAASGR